MDGWMDGRFLSRTVTSDLFRLDEALLPLVRASRFVPPDSWRGKFDTTFDTFLWKFLIKSRIKLNSDICCDVHSIDLTLIFNPPDYLSL